MKPKKTDLISEKVLSILWEDGHESLYFADHLRKNCPCAECEKIRDLNGDKAFPSLQEIKILNWQRAGNYALTFEFSDHHTTGIYSYELLRKLCQCDDCAEDVIHIHGPFH